MTSELNQPELTANSPITRPAMTDSGVLSISGVWMAASFSPSIASSSSKNCRSSGTQPLCYCRGLKLVNCEMIDTDLAFERSDVEAAIITPVVSIKNPLSGRITVPAVGEIIRDIPEARGEIVVSGQRARGSACA